MWLVGWIKLDLPGEMSCPFHDLIFFIFPLLDQAKMVMYLCISPVKVLLDYQRLQGLMLPRRKNQLV